MAPAPDSSAESPAAPRLGYRPELDGLRGVAAVVIVLFHCGVERAAGGFVAVDAFFVLSGFLITALLMQEHARAGRINLGHFYARRVLRLAPALALYLTAILIGSFVVPHTAAVGAGVRREVLYSAIYAINWTIAFGHSQMSPVYHTWSLAVEEQFYLLIPLLIVGLLAARARPLGIAAALGVMGLLSAADRTAMWASGAPAARAIYGLDARADSLLAGCTMGALWAAGRLSADARNWRWPALAGALAMAAVVLFVKGGPEANFGWVYFAAWASSAAVLGYLLCRPDAAAARALRAGPTVYLGRLSYGLYLWHFGVIYALDAVVPGLPTAARVAAAMALSLATAAASHHAVEQPILRLKRKLAAPAHGALPTAPTA